MTLSELTSNSGIITSESFEVSDRFVEIECLHSSKSGYCDLFRAKRMGKWFVLKTLKKEYRDNPAYQELLKKEFGIGYQLSHPNIAQTLSFERVEKIGWCIVLEYIDGVTLRQLLDEHSVDCKNAAKIIGELCDALQYIHSAQIIHRDLKPDNILITRNGENVKVIDFGLSDSDSYAILKQPAGSLHYAAPEQVNGDVAIDSRVDIYAFGVIISELPCQNRVLRRIAKRCCKSNRNDRFDSTEQIKTQLNKKSHWGYIISGITLVVMVATGLFVAYNAGTKMVPPAINTFTDTVRIVQVKDSIVIHPQVAPAPIRNPLPGNITAYNQSVNYFNQKIVPEIEHHYKQLDTLSTLKGWEIYAEQSSTMIERLSKRMEIELSKHMGADEPEYNLYVSSLKQLIQDKWLSIYNANAEKQRDAILRMNDQLKKNS